MFPRRRRLSYVLSLVKVNIKAMFCTAALSNYSCRCKLTRINQILLFSSQCSKWYMFDLTIYILCRLASSLYFIGNCNTNRKVTCVVVVHWVMLEVKCKVYVCSLTAFILTVCMILETELKSTPWLYMLNAQG